MPDVLIIAGSKSDQEIVEKTTTILSSLDISYAIEYASAHREPERVQAIVKSSDAKVMIAIAGLSAALPGVVASHTSKPVIGVPVNVKLEGLDALLSMMQMPKGVPVATVGIDNGQNAAYLAARILSITKQEKKIPQTYAEAGIDESLVERGLEKLGEYVRESFKYGRVTQDFGHYANTVKINDDQCIALSTDGVGSKILVAEEANKYDTIGIDCVGMNVNDLICIGARPIGFVDYLASEQPLSESIIEQIGKGLLQGCKDAEIPILGGETAILPDMIKGVGSCSIDLAGTAVGLSREEDLFDGSKIVPGDVIIGVASNGIHSNGFTLARRVLLDKFRINETLPWGISLADELLKPTKIYVKHFDMLREKGINIKGIAHITGLGFRKITRLGTFRFVIEHLPELPSIFQLIKTTGNIEWKEMFSTFNMGIGLIVVVPPEESEETIEILAKLDSSSILGCIKAAKNSRIEIPKYGVVLE